MAPSLVDVLRCPESGEKLHVQEQVIVDGRIKSGWLVARNTPYRYPIKDFIPRFVPVSNYANNFGMQWNKFRQTQLDSYSGHPISSDRFWKSTGWQRSDLKGKWVLDVGCGAGRFAEVALSGGAKVVALDYSSAVDACYDNLKGYSNLTVVQGNIYALPFPKKFFSFVYSLGVLQHTPDVAKAFAALPPMLLPGGQLCVDFYEDSLKSKFLPKFWLRPITKRMPQEKLFKILDSLVPKILPFSRLLAKVPMVGVGLKRLVPVANYEGILPLNEKQLVEWALLDTFDWLSPQFDNPQSVQVVNGYLSKAGLEKVQVFKLAQLVGRGMIPKS